MTALQPSSTLPISVNEAPTESRWKAFRKHLNFFRIHIIVFTLTPLFFSGIFYASNGEFHISYIDSLFQCVSAMAVCGLATVDLSSLTGWQQAILFIQMCLGSPVVVSWVMVYLRRYYFAKKFDHIIASQMAARAAAKTASKARLDSDLESVETGAQQWSRRFASLFRKSTRLSTVEELTIKDSPKDIDDEKSKDQSHSGGGGVIRKLRPDMIRRMDDAPKLVDPNGWISQGGGVPMVQAPTALSNRQLSFAEDTFSPSPVVHNAPPLERVMEGSRGPKISGPINPRLARRRLSDPGLRPPSVTSSINPMPRHDTVVESTNHLNLPRTTTIEFAPNVDPRRGENVMRGRRGRTNSHLPEASFPRTNTGTDTQGIHSVERRSTLQPSVGLATYRTLSLDQHPTYQSSRPTTRIANKHEGFGGFPMPHEIIASIFRRFFPRLQRQLTRTVTIPVSTTITSQRGSGMGSTSNAGRDGTKVVPYISFDAVVGRNSAFHLLTSEQLEELGGVEYRALNALLWIVPIYHFGSQLLAFTVIAPYMTLDKWNEAFRVPNLHKNIGTAWYSAFQVVSAYTNTGTSLVDQSMVPFQTAYPEIFFLIFVILAGNTAFPVFLRFMIWVITKLVPSRSRTNETLHFLLDHPRRCFIYLFPSHQTWFLLTIIISLTFTDWFFFMVLDIGNSAIDSIPLGIRFVDGLLQAAAVRAAGFGIVPLASLAPAVKVLYVVMMYISVYPIAMSVRSTNVYEEQSLGLFQEDEDSDEEEEGFQPIGPRVTVWSRYLAMHARRQLAFDMWWLGLAIFLVCIIERGALNDANNATWFNIFNIVFELVSAYGTVGLSLGLPTANYSFSGAFRPLSKLIVCVVMLRGRHRGLPVAIDRAVMLPAEYRRQAETSTYDDQGSSFARPASNHFTQGREATPLRESSAEKRIPEEDTEMHRRRVARRNSSREQSLENGRRMSYQLDREMSSE